MERMLIDIPSCVFNGSKNRRWRPKDSETRERAEDSYKKAHVFSVMVFSDLFGRFIRIEITDKGAESDRTIYVPSDICKRGDLHLSGALHGMADMEFSGDGDLVVPYKRNESTSWLYRSRHNQDISSQRMVKEWGIGFISKRFRLFIDCWPFEPESFAIAYQTAAMVSNWQFNCREYALQTRERYPEKLERSHHCSN